MEDTLKIKLIEGEATIRTRITRKIFAETERILYKKLPAGAEGEKETMDCTASIDQKDKFVLLMLVSLKINGKDKEINEENISELLNEDFDKIHDACEDLKIKKKEKSKE